MAPKNAKAMTPDEAQAARLRVLERAERRSKVLAAEAVIRAKQEQAEKALTDWMEEVPERFRDWAPEDVLDGDGLTEQNRRVLRAFVREPHGFLVLQGPTGVGKTTAACAVVKGIIERYVSGEVKMPGARPMFRTNNTLLRELSDMEVSRQITNRALRASVLVLDDIGGGNSGLTAHQERIFWSILKERDETPSKATIITTNMPLANSGAHDQQTLSEFLGDALWDRITSSSSLVIADGDSLRHD